MLKCSIEDRLFWGDLEIVSGNSKIFVCYTYYRLIPSIIFLHIFRYAKTLVLQ